MAREVRVLAEPDFPVTIFEEIQTSPMSTGRTLLRHTPRSFFFSPSPSYKPNKPSAAAEKFLKGVWGKLFPKKFPPSASPPEIFCTYYIHFPHKPVHNSAKKPLVFRSGMEYNKTNFGFNEIVLL